MRAMRGGTTTFLAVAALLLGAATGGVVAAGPVAAGAASRPDGDAASLRAARSLLAYVPPVVRGTCLIPPSAPTDPEYVASLRCPGELGNVATYTKFGSADAAARYLETLIDVDALAGASTDPAECPSVADNVVQSPGSGGAAGATKVVGRVYCTLAPGNDDTGLDAGAPVVTWTVDDLGVVARAWNIDDPSSVHEFAGYAAPLGAASARGIPPQPTPAQLQREGKRLLAQVPAASKTGCRVLDRFSRDALGSAFEYRLWLVAALDDCSAKRGPDAIRYLRFATVDMMNQYFSNAPDPDLTAGDPFVTMGTLTCPGRGTIDADGANIGRVKCRYQGRSDGDGRAGRTVEIEWTAKPLKVVGLGTSAADRTRAVMQWWRDDAGPVLP